MAVTPNSNEAFVREVDDELRRDKMAEFGKRWGIAVVVAVVVALCAFGGYLYWQHHRQVVAGEQGETLQRAYDALAAEDVAKAQVPLTELADSGGSGYRALAKISQADILLQKNDLKGAAAKFAEVANDNSLPQPFRNQALIRQTAAEFDTLKPQVVVERLRPLAVVGNPWFGSAGEMVAVSYLRMNRSNLAGPLFAKIAADEGVPDTIRQRAVQMAGAVGVDAIPQNEGQTAK
ncbi:MAG: tetratricopeptide repeat protein [Pseudomonadota bacterium]|nr:tetratricopeptide repeat protein [Pseudomonadota bacterium]